MDSDLITPSRSSPESEALDQVVPAANSPSSTNATNATNAVVSGNSSYPSQLSPLSPRRLSRAVVVSAIAVVAILGIGSSLVFMLAGSHSPKLPSYKPTTSTLPSNSSGKLQLQDVLVNGQLYVNNSLVIAPTVEPGNPTIGQLYLSIVTKQLSYYNGSQFIALGSSTNTNLQGGSTTLQGATIGARGLQGPAGASGGTSTSASTLVSGTLSDNRLSPNVALLNRDSQTFHGRRQAFQNTANDLNAYSIQAADGTPELTVDTVNNTVTTTDLLPRVGGVATAGKTATTVATSIYSGQYIDSNNWVTVGSDGFTRFVYPDGGSHQDLHFVRCLNLACTSENNTSIVTGDANWVDYPTIRIAPDGFPRIMYIDYAYTVHYVLCANADCSVNTDTVVDNAGNYDVNFELDSSGFALIVNGRNTAGQLVYIRCLNAACSTHNTTVLQTGVNFTGNFGANNIVIGQDGLPRVIYIDANDNPILLHLIRCLDIGCTSNVKTVVFTSQRDIYPAEAFIGTDGSLRIVLLDLAAATSAGTGTVRVLQCNNADCTAPSATAVATTTGGYAQTAVFTGARLGTDNLIRLTYDSPAGVHFVSCSAIDCSTRSDTVIDSVGDYPINIALDGANNARIIDYHEAANQFEQVLINTPTGTDINVSGSSIGSSSSRYGVVYSQGLDAQDGTGNLLQLQNNSTTVASIANDGTTTFKTSTNSTSAFQVQNSSGASALTVDTTNTRVDVGTSGTPTGQLYVSGTLPTFLSAVAIPSTIGAPIVALHGNYAYATGGYYNGITFPNSLQVIDISNPNSPSIVGSYNPSNSDVGAVAIAGHYAYVTLNSVGNSANNSLKVLDISDPTNPTPVGSLSVPNADPYHIEIFGHYAYMISVGTNLNVIDISNPTLPSIVGSINVGFKGYFIINGHYLYATGVSGELGVWDISNPKSPSFVTQVTPVAGTGYGGGIAVAGKYLYMTMQGDGATVNSALEVIDISNPASPTLVGSYNSGTAHGFDNIVYAGQYAYVADRWFNALQVFNIANPRSPSLVGTISNVGIQPASLAMAGRHLYLGDAVKGLSIFDLGGTYSQQLQTGGAELGNVQVDNEAAFSGNVNIQNNLQVSGDAVIGGNFSAQGTLSVNGTSTTAFQIQNTSATSLFSADTSNMIITIAGTPSTFANLTLTNAHLTSTQTTAPTASTPTSCGTSPSGAVTAGSTDSIGSFTLNSGSTSTSSTCQIVITFNKAYSTAPKSVLITGANTSAAKMTPAVTATSSTTFTVELPQTDAVSTAYQFYYLVFN